MASKIKCFLQTSVFALLTLLCRTMDMPSIFDGDIFPKNPLRDILDKGGFPKNLLQSDRPKRAAYCTPETLDRFPGGWPNTLDVGIYWFGHGDRAEKATNGDKSQFFDPSRKTVLYFHGWTGGDGGWTDVCKRVTTRCPEDICPDRDWLMDKWLDDGWNVGFFYWDQFADEECTRDAEQKIWFDRKGDGFRWKSFDSNFSVSRYHEYKKSIVSVTDLCVDTVKMALGGLGSSHVRFVGHSIGAQLAIRCAAMLHYENHPAAPQRLALLEPYFTKHHMYMLRCTKMTTDSGILDFTAKASVGYVESLWHTRGVVTEIYKSSVFTEMRQLGVPNEKLEQVTTFVEYKPHWCGGLGPISQLGHLKCRHDAVFPLYFLSYGWQSPPVVPRPTKAVLDDAAPGSAVRECTTPSASCTDGQIREWIQRQIYYLHKRQRWVQVRGYKTVTSKDDIFRLSPDINQQPKVLQEVPETLDEKLQNASPWYYFVHHPLLLIPVVLILISLIGVPCIVYHCCKSCHDESDTDNEDEDEDEDSAFNKTIDGCPC